MSLHRSGNRGSLSPGLRLALFLVLIASVANRTAVAATPIDFGHDVVPVLRKHCVGCHGGKEAKGSFSINTREVIVESGNVDLDRADDSYLLELIASSDPELQMPPAEHERLTAMEVATLRRWIAGGMPWEAGFTFGESVYEPPLHPRLPELPAAVDNRTNPVDRILDAYLVARDLPRPGAIDDATFYRRVHLDLIGLLPEPAALAEFLADPASDKRERAVDRLLSRRVAYADHWMTFFNDLLRNDYSGTGFITGGRRQITTWLYDALRDNMPFDQFARELIAPPTPASGGYIEGIKWRGEVSAGQRLEIQFAQNVSQSFLGINMKCASCHDSFIDRWTLDEAYGLAAVYATRPLEIHRCDKPTGKTAQAGWLFPELGQIDPQAPQEERLQQLASLMTHPENGRFTRTIVNRLWYKLMGRGIVHPLDAMQSEPWNTDLLDYLACYLADRDYDLKQVLRLIATSEAYQSVCEASGSESAEDDYIYRGPRPRRMTAEQFLDAVWQLTGKAPSAADAAVIRSVAEPSPGITTEVSSAAKASSDPLSALGETPMVRASLLKNNALMRSLGRPTRDQIVSMRPDELTTLEAIDLANEQSLADAFEAGAKHLIDAAGSDPDELLRNIYAFALSREPTADELAVLKERIGDQASPAAVQDVLWAICMLPEFMLIR